MQNSFIITLNTIFIISFRLYKIFLQRLRLLNTLHFRLIAGHTLPFRLAISLYTLAFQATGQVINVPVTLRALPISGYLKRFALSFTIGWPLSLPLEAPQYAIAFLFYVCFF